MDSLHQIRVQAVRLERYCRPAKDKIWSGNRDDFIGVLSDLAEISEISRRTYSLIEQHISTSAQRTLEQTEFTLELGAVVRRSFARVANEVHVARQARIRRLFDELIPPPIDHGQGFDNDILVRVSYPVIETERFVRYVRPDAVTVPAQELETLRRAMRPWFSQLTVFVDLEPEVQLVG